MSNIEQMLAELVRYSRETTNGVSVERMVRVVAGQIDREINARVISAMSAQMSLIAQVCGGHA